MPVRKQPGGSQSAPRMDFEAMVCGGVRVETVNETVHVGGEPRSGVRDVEVPDTAQDRGSWRLNRKHGLARSR
jgi:hypothetical protein